MTKPKYKFSIYTKADGILIKPSTVAANTVGDRVTNPTDLTVGRWYAVFTNATSPHTLLRAKYLGSDMSANHVFKVCPEDYGNIPAVSRELTRTNENLRTGKDAGGGTFGVYKFKQANQQSAKPVEKQQKSPTGRMQASAPALQNVPKPNGVKPEVSPYEDSDYATAARYGLKPGDKFEVINADGHNGLTVGDVVTLKEDDASSCPYFINHNTGSEVAICLYRLVPLVVNPAQPIATLSTVDQIKSEIDALNAQKQIKQEEIDKLTKDVATIGGEVDKLKQKVADSLKEYLPEPKSQSGRPAPDCGETGGRVDAAIPLSTGGIDPRAFGPLD